jgi:hypothetical protein
MKTRIAIFVATLCLSAGAFAETLPQPGDFYLISRDPNGKFLGSHKLFKEYASETYQMAYCSNQYFVRGSSIAWTQLEAERGNVVHVEFNFGRGWRPICPNPERQVTLADIGVTMSAREYLASLEEGETPVNRLAAIGALFRSEASHKPEGSFHSR